jgi:hypothetical protein
MSRVGYEYWLWDLQNEVPVCLHIEWTLRETLARLSEQGFNWNISLSNHKGFWDSGLFCYEVPAGRLRLSDSTYVKGNLTIQYSLENRCLTPHEMIFEPTGSAANVETD